jgi:hypothetical protein
MDENEKMDPSIIKGLFDQGVRPVSVSSNATLVADIGIAEVQLMAIETDPDHGGAGASFTSAILVIEELAKIDPAVSVCCDVHNTLVNTVLRKYASDTVKDKYLPQLSSSKVSFHFHLSTLFRACTATHRRCSSNSSVLSHFLNPLPDQTLLHSRLQQRKVKTVLTTLSLDPRCGSPTLLKLRSSS